MKKQSSMKVPLTVALMTYNRSHYLRESLTAIIGQTYKDFELLVLDNGSVDDTPQVVLGFKDERIRYVRNPPGHTARFNGLSAIWIARGEKLLVTHDDDIMEPRMLEQQMQLFELYPTLTAVWTNQSVIDANGVVLQSFLSPIGESHIYQQGEYIARAAEEKLWHPPSSMIFVPRLLPFRDLHRKYLNISGSKRRQAIDGSGEHILTATMNLHGPVAFLNAPLLRYRQHSGQESHHMHLAHAILHRFQSFRRFVRHTRYRDEYEPVFDAQIARFKAQDLLIHTSEPQLAAVGRRRMRALVQSGSRRIESSPRSGHAMLPLFVLLTQIGALNLAVGYLEQISTPDGNSSSSVRALYRWLHTKCGEGNLFDKYAPGTTIAVLGSSLIAALLILEAQQAKVRVACCLDSNVTRQGHTMLGVPIVPHDWLSSSEVDIDLVLLSSERDREEELMGIIRQYATDVPVVSWKILSKRSDYHELSPSP